MGNIWYAINPSGERVAEFLSRDYDPDRLVDEYGPVTIFDQSDNNRWVDSIIPARYPYARQVHAVRG